MEEPAVGPLRFSDIKHRHPMFAKEFFAKRAVQMLVGNAFGLTGLHLGHALGRRTRRRALLGRVLGRTLGLKLLGVEHAIPSKAAVRQSLRVVFKCIWRGFSPAVNDRQDLIIFNQHEFDFSTCSLNRARLNISRHPKPFCIRTVAHAVEFLYRYVIAFALLHTRVCQIP